MFVYGTTICGNCIQMFAWGVPNGEKVPLMCKSCTQTKADQEEFIRQQKEVLNSILIGLDSSSHE